MNEQPIVGWLVCTEGENKGKDYRITRADNYIGTSDDAAIMIKDDKSISDYHAVIRFDERCGGCYISPGQGRRIIRYNGNILFSMAYINPFDRLEFGRNEYVYLPYGVMINPNAVVLPKKKTKESCMDVLSEFANSSILPVVGWLVNRDGENQGKDYRLSSDFNYIGYSENMDVIVAKDDSASGNCQGAVVYDPRENVFFFAAQPGGGVAYINGQPINGIVQIKGYEDIMVGKNRFVFVPFCGDFFRW